MKFTGQGLVRIHYSAKEEEAVKIAATTLKSDFYKVLESRVCLQCTEEEDVAVFGAQNGPAALSGKEKYSKEYAIREVIISSLACANGVPKSLTDQIPEKKEGYLIAVEENVLYLLGNDRRGTIYAVYEFSEMLGVSPWHFFADVPAKKKESFELAEGFRKSDYPSVEYRGIFINDEEELEKWVVGYMEETTIGPKTYAHIFELLLRLKCNYLWPAMHVNSFNANVENGRLAERMGIVIGTSHCDMLMRSNHREWEPWKRQKGYNNLEYDFSIEGENREKLLEYWRESIIQNREFEVTYTLGMRGIHDSGFVTKALNGLSEKELLRAKIDLLSQVLRAQNQLLEETPHKEALKLFVPYKEVLELYDNGLEVPEDFTLIWTNDNYGHVRRYPGENAKNRSGGHGLYYHNSYWAPPGASYLFLCTIPFAKTRNELLKAYENGVTKLWVTNFGAIKPLELHLSYYADLAFNIGKENEITADAEQYLAGWLDKIFGVACGKELAPLLLLFDQVVNLRKVELMEDDVFCQSADYDEAAGRIHFLRQVFDKVNEVYDHLPPCEKDAFFQMILFRVHAAYYTNYMYYAADRSVLMASLGKDDEADEFYALSEKLDKARQSLITYYNEIMLNGKWHGIVLPEDYPPPRTAMYPAAIPGAKTRKELGISALLPIRKATEDKVSHRITIEAEKGWKNQKIKTIPYLGRGVGSLVEFESNEGLLSFCFTIEQEAEYHLSLERFPSLNSVGEIGIDICMDNKEPIRVVSASNDEHRGVWKTNILNDGEILTVPLGKLAKGEHQVVLTNATRYFAITRIHIYEGEMKRNHFWQSSENNPLLALTTVPETIDLTNVVRKYYAGATPGIRRELSFPIGFGGQNVLNEDMYGYYPEDEEGAINIPLCDGNASFCGEIPDVCIGIGRKKPGLYFRDAYQFEEMKKNGYPKITYPFEVPEQGTYVAWICVYGKGNAEYAFSVEMDENEVLENTKAKRLWKYSSENVYKWIPIVQRELLKGKHSVSFTFRSAKLRLEGICFTKI